MANPGLGNKFAKSYKPTLGITQPSQPSNDKTTIWLDSADGDFDTAGNWDNGVPASGDTMIFNQGSVDLDTNLAQSGITVQDFLVHEDYTGNLGDGTNPLQISAELVKINKRTGFVHIKGEFIRGDILDTSGDTNAVKIESTSTGNVTDLYAYASRSDILIGTSNRLVNCYVVPKPGRTVELDINTSASHDQTKLHVDKGGFVTSAKDTTTVDCDGGVLTLSGSIDTTALTLGQGTTINQSDGTHTLLVNWGGTFSMHQNEDTAATITDATLRGGKTILRNNLAAAIVTNPIEYWAGELWTDVGAVETVT